MARAFIGVGSNLAGPAAQVDRAIRRLETLGTVRSRSSLYATQPWGKPDQPSFVNAAVELETPLGPHELLHALKLIEQDFGRDAKAERWGPRVVDLDILTYDDIELDEPHLRIPHAHLHERAFVLVPLAEIDERFAESRDALPERDLSQVRKL